MIKTVENPIMAVKFEDYPSDLLPEFLLLGRSNVGKSSFINTLLDRKNLAYTSSNPGKTQTLNFYRINTAFYFVDAPGYGYAKVSKKQREAFGRIIEKYIVERETLRHAFLLIDLRHAPTEGDKKMVAFLQYVDVPFTIIGTKADKLSNNQRSKQLSHVAQSLELNPYTEIIPFSAVTKHNRDVILAAIIENAALR